MSNSLKIFQGNVPLNLECGKILHPWHLAYTTYGELNSSGDNVIWIMHAFSANSDPMEWWPGMVGEGRFFDPYKHFIVCANILGSCYGSTGPHDLHPVRGGPYGKDFPLVTNRDVVRSFDMLRKELGVNKIKFSIGASLGGQQLLEWAIMVPELFDIICPVSTNAKFSPWGIALNETQRMALEQDPSLWYEDPQASGKEGIKTARAIAMLSYRTYRTYQESQYEKDEKIDNFNASSYQRYQGLKLAKRFSAQSYWFLSKMMDAHDVGRGRGGTIRALAQIRAKAYILGVSSDHLFPIHEQKFLAKHIADGHYIELDSFYGHDGFLIEFEQLTNFLQSVLTWD